MVGNILFRKTLQYSNKLRKMSGTSTSKHKFKIDWEHEITNNPEAAFLDEWMDYFRMLVDIVKIQQPRSVKPLKVDPFVKPQLITFSDGNEPAFGTVAYVLK